LTRPLLVAAASFTLFHTAMLFGSVALPLYLTRTLERPNGDVGLLFSVCALVEVPAALSLTLLPARVRKQWVILLGMMLFVAYFLLVAASSSMPLLIGTTWPEAWPSPWWERSASPTCRTCSPGPPGGRPRRSPTPSRSVR
jgi:predicted MFS family arabinose efflux permease